MRASRVACSMSEAAPEVTFSRPKINSSATRRREASGFWELFVPGLRPGHLYKYEILGADGQLLPLKADPQAEQCEKPPNTASIIAEPSRHLWRGGGGGGGGGGGTDPPGAPSA